MVRFGNLIFDRTTGAHGDAKELEYVSALLQCCEEVQRVDGSLKPKDVALYLYSRFGITVPEDTVKDLIFTQLAAGSVRAVNPVYRKSNRLHNQQIL